MDNIRHLFSKKWLFTFIFIAFSLLACKKQNETSTTSITDFQALPVADTTKTSASDTTKNVDAAFGKLLGKGNMSGYGGHFVSGVAAVYLKDNSQTFYFQDLVSTNGPDLYVYLSKDIQASDLISLGKLKSTNGNQIYNVQGTVDIKEYKYALIYCKQYSVLFGTAELK